MWTRFKYTVLHPSDVWQSDNSLEPFTVLNRGEPQCLDPSAPTLPTTNRKPVASEVVRCHLALPSCAGWVQRRSTSECKQTSEMDVINTFV